MDRFIEPALRARIQAELDAIEREETVKILLAVESGSRAWGFPSRDSDYDVRFLYVRPIESYLAVTLPRDVIERPVDAVLDVNGWDLRKALQLMDGLSGPAVRRRRPAARGLEKLYPHS